MIREPTLDFEFHLCAQGHRAIIGLDEAGRGSWAGPIVAGAVALPVAHAGLAASLTGVRDSKQLSARQRERLFPTIHQIALGTGVGFVPASEIDRIGIVPATRKAMLIAVSDLGIFPDYLLIDALRLPDLDIPQLSIVKGDVKCLTIASASIVAKVARDRWMIAQEVQFPGYGFAAHKGYGTARHREAIERLGPCALHRMSFAPLRRFRDPS